MIDLVDVVLVAGATVGLFAISAMTIAYTQLEAVERGSPWLHTAGIYLGLVVQVTAIIVFAFAVEKFGIADLSLLEIITPVVISTLALSPMLGDRRKYRAARELYILHESDDEDWTDVWARHGSAWRKELEEADLR